MIKIKNKVFVYTIFLLMFLFLVISFSNLASAKVQYYERIWIKEADNELIGEHTLQSLKTVSNDEIEVKLKKMAGLEENNNKNYDLSNIPVKLYELVNLTYDDVPVYSLIDTKYINLKTKEEDIVTFKEVYKDHMKIDIGFGTVTYTAGSDTIEVTGTETLESVFQADKSNGWGQISKYENNIYSMDCFFIIGNATTKGNLIINQDVLFINKTPNTSDLIFRISNGQGKLNIDNSSIYMESSGSGGAWYLIQNQNILNIHNSSIMHNDTFDWRNRMRQSTGIRYTNISDCFIKNFKLSFALGSGYIKNSMLIGSADSPLGNLYDGIEIKNIIMIGNRFGLYTSTLNTYENLRWSNIAIDDIGGYGTSNMTMIDCTGSRSNGSWSYAHDNPPNTYDFWRANTFNLTTTNGSRVRLWNNDGKKLIDQVVNGGQCEVIVNCSYNNITYGKWGYKAFYPFTLNISQAGYYTYNHTFNNNFTIMQYVIYLDKLNETNIGDILQAELEEYDGLKESDTVTFELSIGLLGLVAIAIFYILMMWKRDSFLAIGNTVVSLATGVYWLGQSTFSIGWWLGIMCIGFSPYFIFLIIYFLWKNDMKPVNITNE